MLPHKNLRSEVVQNRMAEIRLLRFNTPLLSWLQKLNIHISIILLIILPHDRI